MAQTPGKLTSLKQLGGMLLFFSLIAAIGNSMFEAYNFLSVWLCGASIVMGFIGFTIFVIGFTGYENNDY